MNDQEQTTKFNVVGDKDQNFMRTETIDRRMIYREANINLQFRVLDSILKWVIKKDYQL